jgi:hypothetical protein
MHRLIGTILTLVALFALGSGAAYAYDSPHKFGIELRGGFGQYDMGDINQGTTFFQTGHAPNPNSPSSSDRFITTGDNGPTGGLSLLYRPSKHTIWEIGLNSLMDVENSVVNQRGDSSGQILMHANEFFLKGSVLVPVADRLILDFGAGVGYYNTELQIQDDFNSHYYYDVDGRGWGVLGTGGLELLLSSRIGIHLGGGFRLTNTTDFTYESAPGNRAGLNALGSGRPMEVNLSGMFGNGGIRFYFDRVTKPVDFTR